MTGIRFGYQVSSAPDADALRAEAKRAEAAGFDVIQCADHVGATWAPLATLAALAEATTRIRVGSLVLNNDFHHPVHLAREIAGIDQLSGGRVELGLGAGHAFPEYQAIGMRFDPPAVRKARLAESVEILRRLFDRETVSCSGAHYELDAVRTMSPLQKRLPILVGVNGRAALTHAAQHADAIGLTMLGRTLDDGQRHAVRWEPERIDRTVAHIRDAAATRSSPLELNALIQVVAVTEARETVAARIAERTEGLSCADALTSPFLAIGTHEEIVDHLLDCRTRWGISFFSVRDIEAFAPIIERIRARELHERDL